MIRSDLKLTAEDYGALPEEGPRHELIDGELVLMPAPTFEHQRLSACLVWLLYPVAARVAGVVVAAPIDVYLGPHDVFQPDLVFVSAERRGRIQGDGIHGAPDLVVEILSPSTRARDLGVKLTTYAREGVREYWVVDLDARAVQVHRLEVGAAPSTHGVGAALATPLLPGFALEVSALFA